MKWTSPDERITLFQGDGREILPSLKFDLVMADPPYGISHPVNYKSRGRGKSCIDWVPFIGDNEPFDPEWLLKLKKPTILWGANYYANKLPNTSGWLVWDKQRPDTLDQATCELAWSNCVKGVRRFVHLWNGCVKASERGEHYHPTAKPVALSEWVLNLRWCQQYKVIADPYMGGGSSAVAAIRCNRSYIGMELTPHYFNIALERVKRELNNITKHPTGTPLGSLLQPQN